MGPPCRQLWSTTCPTLRFCRPSGNSSVCSRPAPRPAVSPSRCAVTHSARWPVDPKWSSTWRAGISRCPICGAATPTWPSSPLLSCLAAHLALRALAGPDRILLPAKRTGVFAHRIARASGLTAGMGPLALVPHSRLNDVPLRAVERAGYDAVLATPEVGWTAAVGRLGPSDLLLLQGHPEYEPSSLLREYRRDALRYLSGERDQSPVLPPGCVGATDVAAIEALHRRVLSSPRDPEAFAAFEFEAAAARVPWTWRPTATQLYANWVAQAAARRGLLPADGGRERAVPEAGPPEPVVAAV